MTQKDKLVIPKVSMYSQTELKKVLDTGLETMMKEDYKYPINYWYSNLLIVCGAICSILGVLAWYHPLPWPKSYWHIVAIIIIYVVVDGYLTYIMWFKHKNFSCCVKDPKLTFYGEMVKYTEIYRLRVEGEKTNSIDIKVNEVFDSNGKLVMEKYKQFVDELLSMKKD